MVISLNEFVRRQTKHSPFSHYEGSDVSLVAMAEANFEKAKPGYRDGVLLIPVPAEGFFCPIVKLEEGDGVKGVFEPRAEGEAPRIHSLTGPAGFKSPAKFVDIVIYSKAVLAETKDNSTDSDWEIISINASLVEDEPQHFLSMLGNHFGMSGGTDTKMSDSEFVAALKKSYLFWFDKALAPNLTK
jgi:hypothetical protein